MRCFLVLTTSSFLIRDWIWFFFALSSKISLNKLTHYMTGLPWLLYQLLNFQPSISPMFYARVFLCKILAPKIIKLCVEIFWHQNISAKCARKMLMKLTTGLKKYGWFLSQTSGCQITLSFLTVNYQRVKEVIRAQNCKTF